MLKPTQKRNLEPSSTQKEYVFVDTPYGKRKHGYIIGNVFYRDVTEKDRMRIFDAWTVNPAALQKLQKKGIEKMVFQTKEEIYSILIATAYDLGFQREFNGGLTHYIARKHWLREVREKPKAKKSKLKFKSYAT